MRFLKPFIVPFVCTALTACGGGGGGDPAPQTPPSNPPQTEPETTTPEESDRTTGENTSNAGSLPNPIRFALRTTNRDSFVHPAQESWQPLPIPTQAQVERYLRTFDDNGNPRRFAAPPIVRFATGTRPERRAAALQGIHTLNAFLPNDWHITVGPDMNGNGVLDGSDVPEGVIFVDLATPEHVLDRVTERTHVAGYASNEYADGAVRSSAIRIAIGEGTGPTGSNVHVLHAVTHELLHALGFYAHVSPAEFGHSKLQDVYAPEAANCPDYKTCFPPLDYDLPLIDGEALQTLYTNFDGWDSTVLRIEGVFDRQIGYRGLARSCREDNTCYFPAKEIAGFGVDWRNGLARPWVTGHTEPQSQYSLANNRELTGTVSWAGALVGFTPSKEAVSGDAMIRVNMNSLNGSVDFDNLQYHATGRTWSDGDLDYSIKVYESLFHRTSGDEGDLFGRFVEHGEDFQRGAVGTLERTDLTAAFGASR